MLEKKLENIKESVSRDDLPIMAIDFGLKRTGIAVSDSKGLVASPLATLTLGENKSLSALSTEIRELADLHRSKSYLIGLPQAFAESHEKIRNIIKKFASELSQNDDRKIIFFDESFSTSDSTNMLVSLGIRSYKLKSKIDKVAAANFLQQYLDQNFNN